MAINAGSVYSELILDASKYETGLRKAEQQMKSFGEMMKTSAVKMESSLSKIDKQYKLWELNSSNIQKAFQGKGKQVDVLKQKIGVLDTELQKNNDLLSKAPKIHENIGRTIKTHEENLGKAKQQYKESSKVVIEHENKLEEVKKAYWDSSKELEKHKENLAKAKQEYGKNSDEAKKYKEILDKSKQELKQASGEIKKHEEKLSEVRKAYSEASGEVMKHEAKLEGAKQKYRETAEEIEKLEDHVLDLKIQHAELNNELGKFNIDRIKEAGRQMEALGNTLTKKVTLPVAGLVTAAGGVVTAFGWKRLTGLDAAQAQLTGLGYAMEDVERISKQVSAAVQGTTMTMAEGTSVAAGALAAGVQEGVELERYIRLVGSATVGAKRDIGGMAQIFNRVQGSGRLMTQELNMIEDGMPGFAQAMSNALGVTQAEFRKMVTEGRISSEQFLDVMEDFAGEMSGAYAQSWDGMVSNTKANIGIIGEHLLGGVFEQSKSSIAEFLGLLRSDAAREWAAETGQKIGEAFTRMVDGVKSAVQWWNSLDEGTQKLILTLGAAVVATGPLLKVGSKLTTGVAKAIDLLGKLTPATTATTTATTAMGGGFSMAGAAAKAGALLLNPWVLGIAAVTVAGIKLYKHLQEDAIPAVKRFDESVSEATQEVVGSFLDMEEQATMALNQLAWSGEEVTVEMAANITGAFSQMGQQVISELKEQKEASISQYQEMFLVAESISVEEQQRILELTERGYNDRIKATEDGQARINEILRMAAEEGREITQGEYSQINLIKEQMVAEGIKVLSDGEQEQLAIMERLKKESGKISALQAAEIVQNSKKQTEEAIANAEQEYNDRLKYAAQLRAQGGAEAEALANKVGDEAKRQYEEAKENARKMHEAVVVEAKAQAEEHVNLVDWEMGEIKTKWQVMVGNVKQWYKEQQEESKRRNQLIKEQDEKLKAEQEQQWKELRQNLSDLGKRISDDAKETWETMRRNTSESWEKAKTDTVAKVTELKEGITTKFDELVADAFNWGSNMLTMFTDGLKSKVGAVGEAASEAASMVKKFLGFASPTEEGPASDSDQWAPNFMAMYAQGFTDNLPLVANAVGEVAEKVANMTDIAMQRLDIAFQKYQLTMQDTADATEMMAAKQEYLKDKLALLDAKLQDTQAELLTVSASKGVASIEAQQLALEVDKLSLEYAKLTKEIEAANKAAEKSKFGLSISNGKGVRSENIRMAVDAALSKGGTIDFNKVTQKWPKNAHGTNFFSGGMTWVGEQGRELIELPRGTKIHSNHASERMVKDKGSGLTQHIHIHSPTPLSPSETARKHLQVSRQLAMEWGME